VALPSLPFWCVRRCYRFAPEMGYKSKVELYESVGMMIHTVCQFGVIYFLITLQRRTLNP
jgi:hypothetical protein